MKTTNNEVQRFAKIANNWLIMVAKDPPTKLSYAIARMIKRCEKFVTKFEDQLDECRLNNCLTDEKTKAILRDEQQQYKFTKEGYKAVMDERQKLLDEEVEIEPYFATELPNDLRSDAHVAFEGFVIKSENEPV